jgi:hypothetical protein
VICEICGWGGGGLVLKGVQAGDDEGDLHAPDANDFPAGRFASENEDAGLGETEPSGKEGAASGVGSPFHRRRGEPQGYPIRQLGHQLILRGPRLHVDGEEDIGAVLSDDGRVGPHLGVAGLSGMAASKRS